MGYMKNHLATVSTAAFAVVLLGLWYWFLGFAPELNFIFIMAVTITWFLALMCWLAQKSADYVHKPSITHDANQPAVGAPIIPITTSGDQIPPKVEKQTGAVSYVGSSSGSNP